MALNVVALISGGKDSMYSMLHCIHQGHRIVALANLHPSPGPDPDFPSPDDEDLNSFMFQTAGHSIIPLYEEVLQLPLYRRLISGKANNTSKDYTPAAVSGDETEDILALLAEVKEAHSEANAVSTGAILSTYQRTRVESVALRLGLVPLAYLWQYPSLPHADASPAALLRHMRSVGLDVRIIKVASGGLDDSFLWQNLCNERTIQRVQKAVDRFGGSILGEGGEFETLVLGGPFPSWKGRLFIDDEHIATVKAGGGEAFLSFTKGSTELLEGTASPSIPSIGLYDKHIEFLLSLSRISGLTQETRSGELSAVKHFSESKVVPRVSFESDGMLYLSNVYSQVRTTSVLPQAHKVCSRILDELSSQGLDSSHVLHATILLRSMSDFAMFNSVYGQLFQHPLPPSRVTIACGNRLPAMIDLFVSVIADANSTERKGLHVQTRSYWAPANIGPYSQARSVPCAEGHSFVFVAGQVPLVPASMERYEPKLDNDRLDFAQSAALSLQHLWRIGVEQHVGFWTGAVAYLAPSDDFEQRAKIALQLWIEAHRPPVAQDPEEDDEDVDVWDQRNLKAQTWVQSEDQSRPLPDFERFTRSSQDQLPSRESHATPGFFAVEVDALPRDCSIEWQSVGLVSHASSQRYEFSYSRGPNNADQCRRLRALDSQAGQVDVRRSGAEYVEISGDAMKQARARQMVQDKLSGRHAIVYDTADFALDMNLSATVIPCRRIIGSSGRELAAGVVIQDVIR